MFLKAFCAFILYSDRVFQLPLHLHQDKHQKCNLTRSLGSYCISRCRCTVSSKSVFTSESVTIAGKVPRYFWLIFLASSFSCSLQLFNIAGPPSSTSLSQIMAALGLPPDCTQSPVSCNKLITLPFRNCTSASE